MSKKTLNGDQAMAYGALSCGIRMVTSYPGSPSSGTVEAIVKLNEKDKIYVEWSCNEKVAMEMGIGASIAGKRALVCTKSVGLNVMIDPLMALNLTPMNGGLVILLGDDPGGYGSQNDQDSRILASSLEIPLMEPSGPAEAYEMMNEAFILSEKFQTAFIVRETRSFTLQTEGVFVPDEPSTKSDIGPSREPFRFVTVPLNAVEKHRALHDRIEAVRDWAESSEFNRISEVGKKGIIGGGYAYKKLSDVQGEEPSKKVRLLKLGVLYPLPKKKIANFLQGCMEVMVVEETEPFLETHIKAIAQEMNCPVKITGKQNRHLSREGELFRWQIRRALDEFIPEFIPAAEYSEEDEAEEMMNESIKIFEEIDNRAGMGGALGVQGLLARKRKDWKTMAESYIRAMEMFESIDMPHYKAKSKRELALGYLDMGEPAKARKELEDALEIFTDLNLEKSAKMVRKDLDGLSE